MDLNDGGRRHSGTINSSLALPRQGHGTALRSQLSSSRLR
jgi:hypothetical protein